jgi:hypothetical protein
MNIYVWIILLLPFACVYIYAFIVSRERRVQPVVEPEEDEYHDAVDDVNDAVCDICQGEIRCGKCRPVLQNIDIYDTAERPVKLPLYLSRAQVGYYVDYFSERYPDDIIEKYSKIDDNGFRVTTYYKIILRKRPESFIKSATKT